MKASVTRRYGSADEVKIEERPVPVPGPGEVLVKVAATSVSTAVWRLRAAAFPGIMWLPGRLMFGLFRPRATVLGNDFAGDVVSAGDGVEAFRPGDRVFGFATDHGAHAEYAKVSAEGAIATMPRGMDYGDAAALPFGALSALVFLRDFAKARAGERVLIVGASGGVGSYAVQIAKAMGAHVTGVASATNLGFVRDLGADAVVDYRATAPEDIDGAFDVILDTAGATRFSKMRKRLAPEGRFVPLNFGFREMTAALMARLTGRKRVVLGVSGDTKDDLLELKAMLEAGTLRPLIDRRFPFDEIAKAHAFVEGRHRRGAVVVDVAPAAEQKAAA